MVLTYKPLVISPSKQAHSWCRHQVGLLFFPGMGRTDMYANQPNVPLPSPTPCIYENTQTCDIEDALEQLYLVWGHVLSITLQSKSLRIHRCRMSHSCWFLSSNWFLWRGRYYMRRISTIMVDISTFCTWNDEKVSSEKG